MRKLLRTYLISFLVIYFYANYALGLKISGNLYGTAFAALLFAIFLLVKPFLDALLFPVNILTFNLFGLLANILMIFLWSIITPEVKIQAVDFPEVVVGPLELSEIMMPYWMSVIFVSLCLIILINMFKWLFK